MPSKLIHVPLSPLDAVAPPVHPPGVVYFGIKPGVSNAEVFAHLQEGMYRACLQAPWMNGKIHKQSPDTPGWRPGQLEIRYNPDVDDNDKLKCYQLRYNELESATPYGELKESGFPIDAFEDEALSWVSLSYQNTDFEAGVEIVAAQANFIPGACLLVTSVHHAACDATGMAVFFKLWAENCRCLSLQSQGHSASVPRLPQEIFDRTLPGRIWEKEKTGHSVKEVDPATWQLIGLEPPGPGEDGLVPPRRVKSLPRKQTMLSRVFYMSGTAFTKLRAKSIEELGTTDVSGNDVFLSLLWRSLMNARVTARKHHDAEANLDMDSLVELSVVHDVRPEFSQLMPSFYAGNAIFHHRPTITLQALVGSGSRLASVAQSIRKSARNVNHENIMDAYMLLKLMPDYSRLQPPRYVTQDNTFFISSMLLLPDENVSFGDQIFTNGGRPEGSRPLVGNRNRSQVAACYVMPRKKHGGIEFVLTLFEDEWPFLLESEEFGRYAPSGFVEVEAFAFGMNFRDVLVALGQLDETFLAHELGGVIKRMGPDTEESGLQVRDRVCGASTGRYSSTSQGHWTSYVKIPDDMSYEWAATIPVGYSTAYHSLFHIARLQKGESVLVHAAAGGFGQAAVILAQWKGAEVFATCSSEAKRDLLAEQYNIPLDHILSSRDASFAPAIMALTNGKGVDVVVNSLAGALLKATWDCIARFGRFIEVGKIDMEASRRLDLTPFRRCATFASVDLMQLREYNRPLSHEALVESVKICHERGEPPALPITEFSISDVEKAMRLMQAGKHMGKLVLVPGAEDLVKVVSTLRPVSLDDANATYLIVGGVTGIGSSVTEWMVSKGAKNLLLISRHATTHPNGPKLQAQGGAAGCNVHIRDCDISDEKSLVELLAESARTLPPIRGVINGAMVLDHTVFERMTHEQWCNGIRSKINSTRNLDQQLPKDLSFFIILSSSLGTCGATSQANYTAGNAYQDALSRHRTKNGLPAVTIDLCVIRKVGYVENRVEGGDDAILARFAKLGYGQVDISGVLRLVEAAIREPLRASPEESQIVMGLTEHTANSLAKETHFRDRRLNALRLANRRGRVSANSGSQTSSTAAMIRFFSAASTTVEEASAYLVEALSTKLSDIFNIPLAEIDVGLPLSKYGVDSLVAVELRNWVSSSIKAKVSVFEILQTSSLTEFGTLLATKSEYMSSKMPTRKEGGADGKEADGENAKGEATNGEATNGAATNGGAINGVPTNGPAAE